MRLIAVVLNVTVLWHFGTLFVRRLGWGEMTGGAWVFAALVIACPIVNLIVLCEAMKGWELRWARTTAKDETVCGGKECNAGKGMSLLKYKLKGAIGLAAGVLNVILLVTFAVTLVTPGQKTTPATRKTDKFAHHP